MTIHIIYLHHQVASLTDVQKYQHQGGEPANHTDAGFCFDLQNLHHTCASDV